MPEPTFAVGDKVTVTRHASHPHLKGRVGIVNGVREDAVYVAFRKTKTRAAEAVWCRKDEVRQ